MSLPLDTIKTAHVSGVVLSSVVGTSALLNFLFKTIVENFSVHGTQDCDYSYRLYERKIET